VNHSQVGEAVSEEEHIDTTRDHHEPGAPWLPGDESLPNVEDAANPKELAGNKHHQDGKEEQVKEASVFVWVYDPESSVSNDQRPNDDALVCSEETDHSSSLCARKIRRDSHQEFPPPSWQLAPEPQIFMPKTAHQMIVHHARGLHEGVTNRRAHKAKTALLQIFAHGVRFRGSSRDLFVRFPCVQLRPAPDKSPDVSIEGSEFFLDFQE
jgi:hypothetical protein